MMKELLKLVQICHKKHGKGVLMTHSSVAAAAAAEATIDRVTR